MGRVVRYAVVGGVMDFTIYIALSLAPLLSEQWEVGTVVLGGLPVAWGLVYSGTATWAGGLSDRVSRTALMRWGLALVIVTCLLFTRATSVWHFYAGLPLIALGMAFFWPSLQAAIADESEARTLTRNLGWFNIAWGAGKGLGVLAGGVLLDIWGAKGFYVAAAVAALLLALMPRVPRGGGRGSSLEPDADGVSPEVRRSFRWAALVANFAAFGMGTTVIVHYPDWNTALGRTGVSYGIVVGGIFLAQTVAFALLLRWPGWHYRVLPHVLLQLLAAGSAVLLATELPVILILPLSLGLGAGFGIAYFSSIYYSLHSDVGRGGRAGLHETILGTGNFTIPLLSGVAARLARSIRAPYIFGAAVLMLSLVVQVGILARTRGRGASRVRE